MQVAIWAMTAFPAALAMTRSMAAKVMILWLAVLAMIGLLLITTKHLEHLIKLVHQLISSKTSQRMTRLI